MCALRPGLLVMAAAQVPVSEGGQPGLGQSSGWLVGWPPSPPSETSALLGRYLAFLPLQQMFDSPCKVDRSFQRQGDWEQNALLISPHYCLLTNLIAATL